MLTSESRVGPETVMLRVLVADDNHDAADSLSLLLRLWGHEVRVAYDGTGALQMAPAYQPHVLLLDLGMPDMDGFQVARQLRQTEGSQVTLIAVTGHAGENYRERSREAGFDHYLVKPTDPLELKALLGTILLARSQPPSKRHTVLPPQGEERLAELKRKLGPPEQTP